MSSRRLILASASPRRRDLLRQIGLAPEVRIPTTDERPQDGESPREMVWRLARAKALEVAGALSLDEATDLVLAADTAVVIGDRALGKPASAQAAREMLRSLRGRTHVVLTGVCLVRPRDRRTAGGVESTEIRFRDYDDALIRAYVASGEPMDKAGAYGIQERGALLVDRVDGSWSNVVGLPVERLAGWMGELGLELAEFIHW
jgi:septum formation protein